MYKMYVPVSVFFLADKQAEMAILMMCTHVCVQYF